MYQTSSQTDIKPLAKWQPTSIWCDTGITAPDQYVAFRGTIELSKECDVEFRFLGASWFVVWLDGQLFAEGPARFSVGHPQYQTHHMTLGPGRHVVAVMVHHVGVPNRIIEDQKPFLFAEAVVHGSLIHSVWKCCRINGFASQFRRINPQLGWVEWCDTRELAEWQGVLFDDTSWEYAVSVDRPLDPLEPLLTANTRSIWHNAEPMDGGELVEMFGYEGDSPSARPPSHRGQGHGQPLQHLWHSA